MASIGRKTIGKYKFSIQYNTGEPRVRLERKEGLKWNYVDLDTPDKVWKKYEKMRVIEKAVDELNQKMNRTNHASK